MRNSYQRYAPYAYCSRRNGEENYHLFLAVPVAAGDAVTFPSAPSYQDSSTVLNIAVTQANGAQTAFEKAYYELRPESEFGPAFDPGVFTIDMTVDVGDGSQSVSTYQMTLVYLDADDEAVEESAILDQVAYNSPYVHLHRANGANGEASPLLPYLLLAPKDYAFETGKEVNLVTNPSTGICEAWIVLTRTANGAAGGEFAPFILPDNLQINARQYYDIGPVTGFFEATTVLFEDGAAAQGFLNMDLLAQHEVLLQIDTEASNGEVTGGERNGSSSGKKKKKAKTRNM